MRPRKMNLVFVSRRSDSKHAAAPLACSPVIESELRRITQSSRACAIAEHLLLLVRSWVCLSLHLACRLSTARRPAPRLASTAQAPMCGTSDAPGGGRHHTFGRGSRATSRPCTQTLKSQCIQKYCHPHVCGPLVARWYQHSRGARAACLQNSEVLTSRALARRRAEPPCAPHRVGRTPPARAPTRTAPTRFAGGREPQKRRGPRSALAARWPAPWPRCPGERTR